jgi:hypothetical protein
VPRIERPAIEADISPITMLLDLFFSTIVATLTQTLKSFHATKELQPIATMRLDVINDLSRRNLAGLGAELAQRMLG